MPVITFKVSAAEARVIKARARARQTTLSEYLREQVLPARRARGRIATRTHRASKLTYDASAGAAVTAEEIAAALADFPWPVASSAERPHPAWPRGRRLPRELRMPTSPKSREPII